MNNDALLREQIVQLLEGGNAHDKIIKVLESVPHSIINIRMPNISYAPWELLEHMRIAQYDILEFVKNPDYVSREWPEGYWPSDDVEATVEKWEASVTGFRKDLNEAIKMTNDLQLDLYAPIKHAPDFTLLRELLLIADHNAYHLAQLNMFRKFSGE